jgi:hypothetical protein
MRHHPAATRRSSQVAVFGTRKQSLRYLHQACHSRFLRVTPAATRSLPSLTVMSDVTAVTQSADVVTVRHCLPVASGPRDGTLCPRQGGRVRPGPQRAGQALRPVLLRRQNCCRRVYGRGRGHSGRKSSTGRAVSARGAQLTRQSGACAAGAEGRPRSPSSPHRRHSAMGIDGRACQRCRPRALPSRRPHGLPL